jgi:hypothetical protein
LNKSKLLILPLVLISLIALTVVYGYGESGPAPNCGSSSACTGQCTETADDGWNYWCAGPGECGGEDNWWACACTHGAQKDTPSQEEITARCEGGAGSAGAVPLPTCAEGDGCLPDVCWPPDLDCEEKNYPTDYKDPKLNCPVLEPEKPKLKLNTSKIKASLISIKVNGEEQLLEIQKVNTSTIGTLPDGTKYYKYYTVARFACDVQQGGSTLTVEPAGSTVASEEEYCVINVSVPVLNDNVKVLVIDQDFSTLKPCAITQVEKYNESCLSQDLLDINFNLSVKVQNETKLVNIACDQDIMIKPFLKTDSQRWGTVCTNPAKIKIEEYKSGTSEANLRTIFDWQRTDVDEMENPYVLNKEACELQERLRLEPAKDDVSLDGAKERKDCAYEPIEDNKCYWIHVTNGTTLKITVSDAAEESYVQVYYKNCSCYCDSGSGIACSYNQDSCSPKPLRDLTCPTSLEDSCDKNGDWLYKPEGSPSCGAIGGVVCNSHGCPPPTLSSGERFGINFNNLVNLGATYDCPNCCGVKDEVNYCVRNCSVQRNESANSNYFGTDLGAEYYWGSCWDQSCQSGYTTKEDNPIDGDYECKQGCVWNAECLDCADPGCEEGYEWKGEPDCLCKVLAIPGTTDANGNLIMDPAICASRYGLTQDGDEKIAETGDLLADFKGGVCTCYRRCHGVAQLVNEQCDCDCPEGTHVVPNTADIGTDDCLP